MRIRILHGVLCAVLLLGSLNGRAPDGQEFIVVMKEGQSVSRTTRDTQTKVSRQIPNTDIYLVSADSNDDTDKTLRKLQQDKSVEFAELNSRIDLSGADLPVDASATLGQSMADLLDGRTLTTFYGTSVLSSYVNQKAIQLIKVDDVRTISTGAGTRVAYIDTGVDPNHPALQPWLEPGIDLIAGRSVSEMDGLSQSMADLLDQSMADLLDDRLLFLLNRSLTSLLNGAAGPGTFPPAFGHGTLVAGAIHIVAPEAKLLPIKAFDPYGQTTMFTIVEGVYAAIAGNADVLNMSFSTPQYSDALKRALMDARAQGVAVVASVGNEGRDNSIFYPASYPNVYGVAATDFDDRLAGFSNYGASVSLAAPGAFVVSTVPGGRYAAAWGTSFSAPLVSGSIALAASLRAHGQSDSNMVINNADSIDALNPGFERKLGKGRINVAQALVAAQR